MYQSLKEVYSLVGSEQELRMSRRFLTLYFGHFHVLVYENMCERTTRGWSS